MEYPMMAIGEEFVLLDSRGALLSVVLEKEIFGTSYFVPVICKHHATFFFLPDRMKVSLYAGSMRCCDIWGRGNV